MNYYRERTDVFPIVIRACFLVFLNNRIEIEDEGLWQHILLLYQYVTHLYKLPVNVLNSVRYLHW